MRRFAFLIAVLVVLAGCSSQPPEPQDTATSSPDGTDAPRVLEAAPTFEVETLDGDTFSLVAHRGRLPVVLNFWAPW